jgi:hypothetical protein
MDLFKFTNPNAPTKMEQGQIINGLKSKMWIERYLKNGEFTLVYDDPGLTTFLPIGTFISHTNTQEIMIVENHEIQDDHGQKSAVTITGRGLETYFEQRVINTNRTFPVAAGLVEYSLVADYTWNQAVKMLSDHLITPNLLDANNQFAYATIQSTVPGTGTSVARTIPRGDLYNAMLNLLKIDGLGIKIIRPGPSSPLGASSPNIDIVIHKGVDKTASVIFAYDTGEVITSDYLWTNKNLKNAALVTGKWVEVVVVPAAAGYARRWMYIDATDIDQAQTAAPVDPTLTTIRNSMTQRGNDVLLAQNMLQLSKAELTKEATKAVYRVDYDVGDLITMTGDYNTITTRRVTEYVEIEDENGEQSYPTLEIDS